MRTLFLRSALVFAPLAFAACSSTPTKEDCEQANYYEIGLEDGKDGEAQSENLALYKEHCPREGVAVDQAQYDYGRKVGLAEYCDENRGKDDAEDGKRGSVCLKEKVPPYQLGYKSELDKTREKTDEELREIREEKGELQGKESALQSEINQIDQQKAAVDEGSL